MAWFVVKSLFQWFSPPCVTEESDMVHRFEFADHAAAVVQQPTAADQIMPPLRRTHIIYLSGIGVQFNCAIGRMKFLSETFQNGLEQAMVWSIDQNNYGSIDSILEALKALYDKIHTMDPEARIQGAGHSMGTGLIVQLATERPLDGILLLNAFEKPSDFLELSNWETLARAILGYNLNTSESLEKIQLKDGQLMPLVVFTNDQDQVIRSQHGSRLAERASQSAKFSVMHLSQPGNHSNYLHDNIFLQCWKFLRNRGIRE